MLIVIYKGNVNKFCVFILEKDLVNLHQNR